MSFEKQVDRSHYKFGKYYSKERWSSLWHQIDEVLKFEPESVLEVGGGLGIFKHTMSCFSVSVTSVDIAEDLNPDILGSVTELPIENNSFDVTCAFQVLEHLPFKYFAKALGELKRVARQAVVISLPDAKPVYPNSLCLPKMGKFEFSIPKPMVNYKNIPLCPEHMWEINRPGYRVDNILKVFRVLEFQNVETYRVDRNPYHRFFVSKLNDT